VTRTSKSTKRFSGRGSVLFPTDGETKIKLIPYSMEKVRRSLRRNVVGIVMVVVVQQER